LSAFLTATFFYHPGLCAGFLLHLWVPFSVPGVTFNSQRVSPDVIDRVDHASLGCRLTNNQNTPKRHHFPLKMTSGGPNPVAPVTANMLVERVTVWYCPDIPGPLPRPPSALWCLLMTSTNVLWRCMPVTGGVISPNSTVAA